MDWDRLRVFQAVAQAQSLTKAGEVLNLSQSAVSRQVSHLEDQLGVTLFHRHARGLLLTEQGEILYRSVAEVSHKLKATETALMDSRDRPRGPLIVTAPVALGTMWLVPELNEFMELYPEITVSLVVTDKELDIAMREADCAIRMHESRNPDLIQRKITTIHSDLYASNDYLRRHGVPKRAEELKDHRLIAYGDDVATPFDNVDWILGIGTKNGEKWQPAFTINSLFGMLQAVECGIGIAGLPDYMANNSKTVSALLKDVQGPPIDVHFVYPAELRYSKRITVFRDFLVRKMAGVQF